MTKPIVNLDEVEFDDVEDNGYFTSKRAQISDRIGAKKLGYNLTELPPGKAQCPFSQPARRGRDVLHPRRARRASLRRPALSDPAARRDRLPGADVAHQIINTGTTTMRYLALSTLSRSKPASTRTPARS